MFKKDFLYQAKHFFLVSLVLQALMINLNFYLKEVTADFYQTIYLITILLLFFYPAILFKTIAPKRGEYFNANEITAHLPYTKKQLMLRGLKPWFIIAPLYFLGTTAMMGYFRTQAFNAEFIETLVGGLGVLMVGLFILGGFTLQLMASQITYLVEQCSWIKTGTSLIAFNLLYIVGVIIVLQVFNISLETIYWQYVVIIGYFILSVLTFLPKLKKMEYIYQ